MWKSVWVCAVLVAGVSLSAGSEGQAAPAAYSSTSVATNAPAGQALSVRVVDYSIDAHIDTDKKALDATETLTYKNLTGQPLTMFPWHLYLNGFQPESTFTSETHFGGGIRDNESADEYPAKKLGSVTIAQITADGFGDLTSAMHFVSPDDGNANDKTVMELPLPHPLAQGDSITFHLRFHDQLPESVARNGYRRDFLMGGQWYPKVGVFWHGKWNCHQYHATTEFFSDFGTFHVRLTLPKRYVLGASGVPVGDQANSDGTQTLSFYAEDVGDFAWAASPHFQVTTGTYLSSMGPVQVRVLALAAHPGAGQRYLKILLGSLDQFDKRFGPYPYKILTLIDPEPDSEIGGMEYPTLITGDTTRWDPSHLTEITAEHEFGHQYWYGMVATNEFEDAWLDEGINSYTEETVTGALLGEKTSALDLGWANASDADEHYVGYVADPDYDPVVRHAWQFRDAGSYGTITYGKSALLLKTLEGIVGRDTMDEAMRTYFMTYRFKHPTAEDFLATIAAVAVKRGRATGAFVAPQVSAQNVDTLAGALPMPALPSVSVPSSLQSYFDQAVYGTRILDYAVESVSSGPAQWWKPGADKPIRSSVTVHRLGDFVLPVTLEVTFDDGSKVRELWVPPSGGGVDANSRWKTFVYVKNAKIVSADIDPDHTVMLDIDHFNDSYTAKANPVPARKVTNLWMSSLEGLEQMVGWLV
jgi:hypothetical protein